MKRNPKVSLCILDEQWPLTYLQVYGDATLEEDFGQAVDVLRRVIDAADRRLDSLSKGQRQKVVISAALTCALFPSPVLAGASAVPTTATSRPSRLAMSPNSG